MAGGEANYVYLIGQMLELGGSQSCKVLDFGCGQGALLARALEKGIDIVGADTFGGAFHVWADHMFPAAKSKIMQIENGKLPFADQTFDVVIANQVFEHVDAPPGPLAEINRVLRPGGAFLACFPTGEVWFEGHVGLYFPHFFRRWTKLQWHYLHALRRLGFGYYGEEMTPAAWSDHMQSVMRESVWYHTWGDVKRWWRNEFGAEPQSMAADYMAYRAGRVPQLAGLAKALQSPLLSPLATFVCHKRAGRVMLIRKRAP